MRFVSVCVDRPKEGGKSVQWLYTFIRHAGRFIIQFRTANIGIVSIHKGNIESRQNVVLVLGVKVRVRTGQISQGLLS